MRRSIFTSLLFLTFSLSKYTPLQNFIKIFKNKEQDYLINNNLILEPFICCISWIFLIFKYHTITRIEHRGRSCLEYLKMETDDMRCIFEVCIHGIMYDGIEKGFTFKEDQRLKATVRIEQKIRTIYPEDYFIRGSMCDSIRR